MNQAVKMSTDQKKKPQTGGTVTLGLCFVHSLQSGAMENYSPYCLEIARLNPDNAMESQKGRIHRVLWVGGRTGILSPLSVTAEWGRLYAE